MNTTQNEIVNYFKIIAKRKYLFLFVSLTLMTVITLYAYSLPTVYRADSTVFIEKSIIDKIVKGIALTPDANDSVSVLKFTITSRGLIEKTLRNMDHQIVQQNKEDLQKFISSLQKRTKVEINKGNLFIVSIEDGSPEFSKKYINTLVTTYIQSNILSKTQDSNQANEFLTEQLALFKTKLDNSEDAIIKFRREQGVYFPTDETAELKEIKDYMRQIDEMGMSINSMEARRARLLNQLNSVPPTVDFMSQAGDKNRYFELEGQLKSLQMRYTETYPEVVHLTTELQNLRHQLTNDEPGAMAQVTTMTSVNPLYQDLQQQIFEVEGEISSLGSKKQHMQEKVSQKEQVLRNVPTTQKKLGVLVQERDSYRQIYQELLARMGQSEISSQMEIGDKSASYRVVDPAILPKIPVSPNMARMILIAIAVGFGCAFGLIFLMESLDQTIRGAPQLEALGVEVLAVIQRIGTGTQKEGVKRLDVVLYGASGLYCFAFFGLFLYELMNHFQH